MAIETIDGEEIEFEVIPARTPRITGFNGRRTIPEHVDFGWPGFLQYQAPTMEEARVLARQAVAVKKIWD